MLVIRRSLRIGTRAGAVAALVYAAFKVVQARRPTPALPDADRAWPSRPEPATDAAAVPREPELVRPAMLETTSLKKRGAAPAAEPPPSEPAPVSADERPEAPDLHLMVVEEREYDLTSTAPPIVSPMAPSAFVVEVPPADGAVVEIEADDDEIVIIDEAGDGTDEIVVITVDDGHATDQIAVVAVESVADAEVAEPAPAEPAPPEAPQPPGPPEPPAPAPAKAVTRKAARKAAAKKATGTKAIAKKATVSTPTARKAATKKATARKAGAKKAGAKKAAATRPVTAWVEPWGGVCPTTHPVKAKLRSAIYHLPGMAAYARTAPDRCYRDAEAAAADGLRPAAR